ncbi:trypsin-like serine protease [Moritella sp. 24]|uniref:trypsin-like serine protease n=1 Tax=Moritella sp. 24 TaxID=2746230 RepID=UPI001BADCAD6|nr:trypsin-like serine protease [Moritella sp. 24]QUM77004.1 trypsin-like serine protease [Moritella sp. 24]
MKKLLIATAILASISMTANAGVGRYDRSVSQFKAFSLQNKFDFACAMNAGSATLIDPYWVITANHVSGSKADGYENRVSCGTYKKDKNGKYITDKYVYAITDPDADFGEYAFRDPKGSDFSLVRLDTPIRGIKPAKLATNSMFPKDAFYEVTNIGFGNYNNRNGGQKFVQYSQVEKAWVAEYSFKPTYLEQSDLQWLVIHGDSGSGITFEKNGESYLFGEIGVQYNTEFGWADTFEDVADKVPWIDKMMKEHGFSYTEEVELDSVMWTSASPENVDDYHAYFSYWKADNIGMSETFWTDDGGLKTMAYADAGSSYSIEFVVPKDKNTPAFDLFVNGRAVAVNIDVNTAKTDALFLKVNTFKIDTDNINVEFKPVGDLTDKTKIVLDYFAVKAAK